MINKNVHLNMQQTYQDQKSAGNLLSVSTVSHIFFFLVLPGRTYLGNAIEIANTGIVTHESIAVDFLVSLGDMDWRLELRTITCQLPGLHPHSLNTPPPFPSIPKFCRAPPFSNVGMRFQASSFNISCHPQVLD